MATPENLPFHITLAHRLHASWEKCEALTFRLYNIGDNWVEMRPVTAPQILQKIIESGLEIFCELDAIARDIAAEDKRRAESTLATGKEMAEAISAIQRDQLTQRFGEIVRSPHKPTEPTPQ
jgi:hypothetical protein